MDEKQKLTLMLIENDADRGIFDVALECAKPPLFDLPKKKRKLVRRNNFFEDVVPLYLDDQFGQHFRMKRETFQVLLNVVAPIVESLDNVPNKNVCLSKKLLFTLWTISKQESFLSVGDRFNIPPSSGHTIFKFVISILSDLMPRYVKWPTESAQMQISNCFEERSGGIPGVVGAIDGCHIPIKQPQNNANDYYNRKQFHSIILQGTCDNEGMFTDVFIGMPGRMHDARVLKKSPLYERISKEQNPLIASDKHLIGDSAYPLLLNLMTPFRDNGHLTVQQLQYNMRFSGIRSIIERTFGILKGKFRRLKYMDVSDMLLANQMISAACMLHNFTMQHKDNTSFSNEIETDFNGELNQQDAEVSRPSSHAAQQKRNEILHSL